MDINRSTHASASATRRSSRLRSPLDTPSSSTALASEPMHRGAGLSSSSTSSEGDTTGRRGRKRRAQEVSEESGTGLPVVDEGGRVGQERTAKGKEVVREVGLELMKGSAARPASQSPTRSRLSTASTSASPLPSLLSHLSLAPSFVPPPSSTPSLAAGTFTFPIPSFSSRRPYPHLHPLSQKRSASRPPVVDKRSAPSPHPHLCDRTKKIKLAHRFFRDEALLAGPQFVPMNAASRSRTSTLTSQSSTTRSTISTSGTSPPSPTLSPLKELLSSTPLLSPPISPSRFVTKPYSPTLPRKTPSWWASASRSGGDGRPSRMSPRESHWCSGGEGWIFQHTSLTTCVNGEGNDEVSRMQALITTEQGALSTSTSGPRMSTSMKRSTRPGRSHSSPPTFSHHGTPSVLAQPPLSHAQQASQIQSLSAHPTAISPLGAAPLKQHLLAVLRMRLAEAGGSSRGSEAGLRFKKWVVWNAYSQRTASDAVSSSSEDEELTELEEQQAQDAQIPIPPTDLTPMEIDSISPPGDAREMDDHTPLPISEELAAESPSIDALAQPEVAERVDSVVLGSPRANSYQNAKTMGTGERRVARPTMRRTQSLPTSQSADMAGANEWERKELERQMGTCEA